MNGIRYVSSGGVAFDLDDPDVITLDAALPLRSREWSYELAGHGMVSAARAARTVTLSAFFHDVAEFDRFMVHADADMINGSPGVLKALGEPGEWWSQSVLLVSSDPQTHHLSNEAEVSLTLVLLDGVWRCDAPTVQGTVVNEDSDGWLDLPTDLPADLQAVRRSLSVTNPLPYPVSWRMTIYGAVSNPSIAIGGNRHMVDVTVPDGGYLSVDAVGKTVVLSARNGDMSNEFGNARRGNGEGSGEYIFQRLPAGLSWVEWDGSFGFDLTPVLERSEPPWTLPV